MLRHSLCSRVAWTLLPMLLVLGFPARAAAPGERPSSTGEPSTIGTATMLPDGAIVLQLRAGGPGGAQGDAQLRHAPADPCYRAVRDHLPALRPDRTVPVPPFP